MDQAQTAAYSPSSEVAANRIEQLIGDIVSTHEIPFLAFVSDSD